MHGILVLLSSYYKGSNLLSEAAALLVLLTASKSMTSYSFCCLACARGSLGILDTMVRAQEEDVGKHSSLRIPINNVNLHIERAVRLHIAQNLIENLNRVSPTQTLVETDRREDLRRWRLQGRKTNSR